MKQKGKVLHRIQSIGKERSGMTMVTILVAFVILVLLVSMFTGVVLMTQNMMQKSDALRTATQERMQKYYMDDMDDMDELPADNITEGTGTEFVFQKVNAGGTTFSLDTSIYTYTDAEDGMTLYSFGKHETATTNATTN